MDVVFQFHGNVQFFNFLPAQLLSDVVDVERFFDVLNLDYNLYLSFRVNNPDKLAVENQFALIDGFLDEQFEADKNKNGFFEVDLSQWYIYLKLVNRFYNEKVRDDIFFSGQLTIEEVKNF